MMRFFRKLAYLFPLFTLACGSSSSGTQTENRAEGDAASGNSKDSVQPSTSAPPVISCMACAALAVLGCADAGGHDLSNDSGVLRDSSGSQMIKQDAGPASKDTQMPNDITPAPTADAGTSADIGSGADAQPMAADAQPPLGAVNVMQIIKRLKAVPHNVIFMTIEGNIIMSPKANIGLPASLPPPANTRMHSTCWRSVETYEWSSFRKIWLSSPPLRGAVLNPSTVLTDAELSRAGVTKANGAMSINDWIASMDRASLDAAVDALQSEVQCWAM